MHYFKIIFQFQLQLTEGTLLSLSMLPAYNDRLRYVRDISFAWMGFHSGDPVRLCVRVCMCVCVPAYSGVIPSPWQLCARAGAPAHVAGAFVKCWLTSPSGRSRRWWTSTVHRTLDYSSLAYNLNVEPSDQNIVIVLGDFSSVLLFLVGTTWVERFYPNCFPPFVNSRCQPLYMSFFRLSCFCGMSWRNLPLQGRRVEKSLTVYLLV